MNSTHAPSDVQSANLRAFPALRRSYRLGDRAKALSEAERAAEAEDDRERLDGLIAADEYGLLESKTRTFRWLLQRRYAKRAREVRGTLKASAESYGLAESTAERLEIAEVLRKLAA